MTQCTALVLRQLGARLMTQAIVLHSVKKAMTRVDAGLGVRAWQCQQINTKDFHGIPLLKEIHLSYF